MGAVKTIPNRDPITGRNKLIFETPEDFNQAIVNYIEHISTLRNEVVLATGSIFKPYMPTYPGLAAYLGINKDTLSNYGNRNGYKEVLDWFKCFSEDAVMQGGWSGSIKEVLAIFILKANYGLVDSIDINMGTQPQYKPAMTAEEILARIPDSLADKYLEGLNE
jgi:hypothetical protein